MKALLAICLVLVTAATSVTASHVINESENPLFLSVLSAESGSYDGETLTLTGVPAVVYFSDRPNRIAGHMSVQEFVEMWEEGADNFADNPPNAALSISNGDVAVVELTNPLLIENGVTFVIEILDGDIPVSLDSSALFIDAFPTAVNSQISD